MTAFHTPRPTSTLRTGTSIAPRPRFCERCDVSWQGSSIACWNCGRTGKIGVLPARASTDNGVPIIGQAWCTWLSPRRDE